jgi:two-component system phosphate regulon sensor histidine kinase PhoR
LEQTIKPYYDFFQNKIPEITSYQGFLDSASAGKYAASVFHDYNFVRRVIFYDALIGGTTSMTVRKNNLSIAAKAVYQYWHVNDKVYGAEQRRTVNEDDFREMAIKLSNYIAFSDTSRVSSQDELFKAFWDVKPDKISYSNICAVRMYAFIVTCKCWVTVKGLRTSKI